MRSLLNTLMKKMSSNKDDTQIPISPHTSKPAAPKQRLPKRRRKEVQLSSSLESSSLYLRRKAKDRGFSDEMKTFKELQYMLLQLSRDKSEFFSLFDERIRRLEWTLQKLAPSPSFFSESQETDDEEEAMESQAGDTQTSGSDQTNSLSSDNAYTHFQSGSSVDGTETSDYDMQYNDATAYGYQQKLPLHHYRASYPMSAYHESLPRVLADGSVEGLHHLSRRNSVDIGFRFPFNEVKLLDLHH